MDLGQIYTEFEVLKMYVQEVTDLLPTIPEGKK
jgi:hypothetical protein